MIADQIIRQKFLIDSISGFLRIAQQSSLEALSRDNFLHQSGRLYDSLSAPARVSTSEIGTYHAITFPAYLRFHDINARGEKITSKARKIKGVDYPAIRRTGRNRSPYYNTPFFTRLIPPLFAHLQYALTERMKENIRQELLLAAPHENK